MLWSIWLQEPGADILGTQAEALVNPVNCVGVVGKGLALQVKRRWPAACYEYEAVCRQGLLRPGAVLVSDVGIGAQPRYVIHFPTKDDWRNKSKVEYIETGLVDLVATVKRLQLQSIAIPALGCGEGGLAWPVVRNLIFRAFDSFGPDFVRLYPPSK